MPCSVPSTPAQPYLGNKTKTSFTIKWTVSYHFFLLELHWLYFQFFHPRKHDASATTAEEAKGLYY